MPQQRPLKVGLTGTGIVNSPDGRENWAVRAHVPALKALPDLFEIAAVCTTRMETATAAAEAFGVPRAFDDIERMLREVPEIDIVCVSVRPVHHHALVMAALRAGKHVYCEQPLGVTTAQAEEMYALAREKGVRTVIGHQSHHEPASLYMADLVRDGFIGRPLCFSHTYFVSNYITPRPSHRQWLFQPEMGGHPGYRSGHSLERVMAVFGKDVTSVSADMAVLVPERPAVDTGGTLDSRQVDNMNYLLRVDDTIMGTMQTSFTAWFGTHDRFEVYGTKGMLMLSGSRAARSWKSDPQAADPALGDMRLYGAQADIALLMEHSTPPERLQHEFDELEIPTRYRTVSTIDAGRATFAVAQTWAAFAAAIHAGRECAPSFRDKLKIHRIWDAAEHSVASRAGWVDVDYSGIEG